MSAESKVAVIIPVRDGEADMAACLATIIPEAERFSAEVIVVDDASRDRTASVADAAGARVIRMPRPEGPYAARNHGWRSTDAEVIVFTDVRNRAEPGWLAGLVALLAGSSLAITGGHVTVGGGLRLAHRLSRCASHVDPGPLLADDFMPFVTTSSMAVRRAALEAVGGFMEVRSGADADMCWRVQLAGLGGVALADDSHMICEPRSSVREIWSQWRRYARAYVQVREPFLTMGATFRPTTSLRVRLREARETARQGSQRDPLLAVVESVRSLGYELTYRRAVDRASRARPRAALSVAYVVDEWVTLSQTFIRDEVAELRRQGVAVEVVALRSGDVPAPSEPVMLLPDLLSTSRATRLRTLISHPAATRRLLRAQLALWPERIPFRSTLPAIAERLRARDVTWVHAHFAWEAAAVAEALAAMLGRGWSFTAHANDIFVANRHLGGRLARADHLVTVCQYNLDELRAAHDRLPPTEIIVCGVEIPPLARRGAEDLDVDVLAVGRLVEKKGFDVLIRAAAALRRSGATPTVEIVGDGPERDHLRELIVEEGAASSVRLLGAKPHAWVLERMSRARVVCLPARIAVDGDRDSMPVVLKEAMARRVPVVASAVAAIPEMIDDTVGRLVEPDDPEALAGALNEILTQPALASRLGDAGRERVEHRYSLAKEVARLRESFEAWSSAQRG